MNGKVSDSHDLSLTLSGVVPLKKPGEMTPRTVLNVFGPMGQGGRYILDPLKTGEVNVDYYSDADLKIGNITRVLHRWSGGRGKRRGGRRKLCRDGEKEGV